jgi:5-methylcytosine-specific restriction protein A
VTVAAWRAGDLSGGQVTIVIDRLGRHRTRLWAEHEAALVPTLAGLSTDETSRVLDAWRAHADADGAVPDDGRAELHHSRVGNRWRTDGDFDALDGELVATALRIATHLDQPGEAVRTPSQKRGDALVDVCKYFLDHQTERPGRRHRPHVNVVLIPAELAAGLGASTLGGTRFGERPTEMLLCDAVLHRVVIAEGEVLDYGRSIRMIPAPLYNAVAIRDQQCRFPGCDRPGHWCDAHHVRWFSHGGSTSIFNLVLLCRRHHRRLHQPGWHAELCPDGTFEVTDSQGCIRGSRPPPRLAPSSRGQPSAAA